MSSWRHAAYANGEPLVTEPIKDVFLTRGVPDQYEQKVLNHLMGGEDTMMHIKQGLKELKRAHIETPKHKLNILGKLVSNKPRLNRGIRTPLKLLRDGVE